MDCEEWQKGGRGTKREKEILATDSNRDDYIQEPTLGVRAPLYLEALLESQEGGP